MAARISITPGPRGGVTVDLPSELRSLLLSVARQMREMLSDESYADSPVLARLFPPASMDDPMEALGFEQLMGKAIHDGKVESATILEATARAEQLSAEEALSWLRCLNDVRLMLGTHLNVTEDDDIETFLADPRTEHNAIVYVALTELVDLIVRAVDPG
ncbi:MAG: DUF2017 family protein [Actinomycetota bacterium]